MTLVATSALLAGCGGDAGGGAVPARDGGEDPAAKDGGSGRGGSGRGDGGESGAGARAGTGGRGASLDAGMKDAGNAGGTGGSGSSNDAGGDAAGGTGGTGGTGADPQPECGNGVLEDGEQCDDDNGVDFDGCSALCRLESAAWTCTGDHPTVCEPTCGDGFRRGVETDSGRCDDENEADLDGCDSTCHVESGWTCSSEPSTCTRLCGNGVLDSGEACDDHNATADDGCTACAVEAHWTCSGAPSVCVAAIDANVLAYGTQIAALSTLDPTAIESPKALLGMIAGDTMRAIDRRPINGMLYGLGQNTTNGTVQLYAIASESGQCTAIGVPLSFTAADGTTPVTFPAARFGIDFNPADDQLRVVDSDGHNFRINPNTGAAVDADLGTNGNQLDASLSVVGFDVGGGDCAYSNNDFDQTVTTLYTVHEDGRVFYLQTPPNDGLLTMEQGTWAVGSSQFNGRIRGFDIPVGVNAASANAPVAGYGFVVFSAGASPPYSFARMDLATGDLDKIAMIGNSAISLAVQNIDAIPMLALTASGTQLVRFKSTSPTTSTRVDVIGVTAGDVLVGIDLRPATGQLFALGVNDPANTASLYRLDPTSGAASLVGSAGSIAFVDGTGATVDLPPATSGYGVDFNPLTDLLRVSTGSGVNFRVHPGNGAAIDGDLGGSAGSHTGTNPDGPLTGLSVGSTGVSGVAFTNNYPQSFGTPVVTAYALDPNANGFYTFTSPNTGSLHSFMAITLNGSPLDFTAVGGFDISEARNRVINSIKEEFAYAALNVGGVGHLYKISLDNGAAIDLGQIGDGTPTSGLAVGRAHVN